ncbi:hypothetical protein OUZ56_030122 [Daphnia magna]|uniref:Uncharacterized protein n=1 Tax=Daphnia magna TaxID=35525 RepID=A0ABQ9ZQB6_9CRUS|nr:hypothetical protein OUZ56_030122 [Daphnia magna]
MRQTTRHKLWTGRGKSFECFDSRNGKTTVSERKVATALYNPYFPMAFWGGYEKGGSYTIY